MLTYTITGDNITIPDRERDYIERRFKGFSRFMNPDVAHDIFVTVSKATAHHRDDSVHVEVKLRINSKDFFAEGVAVGIIPAADKAKEELMRAVTHSKAKKISLFHRSARRLKKFLKKGNGEE